MEFTTSGKTIHPGYQLHLSCQPGYHIGSETENQPFRLVLIQKGAGMIKINGEGLFCTAPALLCLNENDVLEILRSEVFLTDTVYFQPFIINNKFNNINIRQDKPVFTSTELQDLYLLNPFIMHDRSFIGFIGLEPSHSGQMSDLIKSIREELSVQRDNSWPCRSRSYLFQLLILGTKLYEDRQKETGAKGSVSSSDAIVQVLTYIKTHYHEKIRIEGLARQFGINRTTLNSEFYKLTGLPVIEYVIKLRIHLASVLLRDTMLAVAEICDRTGFTNTTHFWRMFKKLTGVSPSDYRNNHCWMKKMSAKITGKDA